MSADILPVEYRDIEFVLMTDRHARGIVMPRFTPANWWECDVCELTPAGYMREYEIKMSVGDFRADKAKGQNMHDPGKTWGDGPPKWRTKHELLAAGDHRGPANFYFVTPPGLIAIEQLPVWSGLIEVTRRSDVRYPFETMVKPAPRLHNEKAKPHVRNGILGSCHGRLHHLWFASYGAFASKRS